MDLCRPGREKMLGAVVYRSLNVTRNVTRNVCGFSVWNWLHYFILSPRNFRWTLELKKKSLTPAACTFWCFAIFIWASQVSGHIHRSSVRLYLPVTGTASPELEIVVMTLVLVFYPLFFPFFSPVFFCRAFLFTLPSNCFISSTPDF